MKKICIYMFCLGLMLTGCAVGPNYTKPDAPIPLEFKGNKNWKIAEPKDHLPKGSWWEIFEDDVLNKLEKQAGEANQDLKAAMARVMQARSVAEIAESEFFPSLDMNPSARRSRTSAGHGTTVTENLFSLPFDLSYELDIWGRVRRSNEAAEAELSASAADYATVLLMLQADVARNYFQLRALDREIDIVKQTAGLREESLKLVQSRFKNGYTSKLDLERAKTELANTEAEGAALRKTRGSLENSLAVLLGKPASNFSLPPENLKIHVPEIAPGLASSLLERRPDVAGAERLVAAANARIGVAKAAFFPTIRLTGSAGYQSGETSSLLDRASRVWSLGPGISLPIFNGGRNRANMNKAEAAYDETVANYRQTVLKAVQEAEDGLTGLHFLGEQAKAQDRAVQAAENAEAISDERYKSGLVSYLDVVDAQRTALQAKRAGIQIWGEYLVTTVRLVKAIGGGWE
ncbi:efflux transporter outer membrane subunit [Desulfonema magnum]|uniref:Efflux transporter, RND family n=1 Tax=Desulfonema magnum TaxID=45655 RepID=A0A975GLA6_9BACT|nr:efflux transporter outer membrane subunit [Desulfonema magnum]QTA85572.1 Efflux transporter, RND family [Desulfonema magnum]